MLQPVEGLFTLTNTRSGYSDKIRAHERKGESFEDKLRIMDSFFLVLAFMDRRARTQPGGLHLCPKEH